MIDKTIGVALVGAGAFGVKHLEGLAAIDGAAVVSLVGKDGPTTTAVAERFGIGHVGGSLDECLARSDVDAVILCTPTPLHAEQAVACLRAGKHVQVEIPLADSLSGAMEIALAQRQTGLLAMCGHTRRFNPSHRWIHQRVEEGAFSLLHLDAQTFFHRRTNTNALGQPRDWTDHLLWHHAAHTVDLFAWQARSPIVAARAMQGRRHPKLGIAMDMSVQLQTANGAICTLALSFNNDGPFGSWFRYIGDSGTYLARYDDLVDGRGVAADLGGLDVSMNGIELQDREFLAAIREGREPLTGIDQVLPCYRVLHALEQALMQSH